jgi:hypothetical protein
MMDVAMVADLVLLKDDNHKACVTSLSPITLTSSLVRLTKDHWYRDCLAFLLSLQA